MATDAERKRRSRMHKAGDHTICLPRSCELAGGGPPPPRVPAPEPGTRGERAAQLWRELAEEVGPAHRVLLDEACRIADRLDRLDRALDGTQDWLRFDERTFGEGVRVTVTVDNVLSEARQQANALRAIVTELRTAGAGKAQPAPKPEEGGLADLLAFAARRRSPTG